MACQAQVRGGRPVGGGGGRGPEVGAARWGMTHGLSSNRFGGWMAGDFGDGCGGWMAGDW